MDPHRAISPHRHGADKLLLTFFRANADNHDLRLAAGLLKLGLQPGARMALMVRPGIDFVSLVFAMLKARIVMVLIDPGLGRRNLIACLQAVNPDGFVAIPLAQAIRRLLRRRFPRARTNVTVGRRWFWGGTTNLDERYSHVNHTEG